MDTGSTTSILKEGILKEDYPMSRLKNPWVYKTLNGTKEVKNVVVTPFPKELKCEGNLQWKIINFSNKNFSGIIGQNFLIGFKAKINSELKFIEMLGQKLYFEEYIYPEYIDDICALESMENDNINNFDLDHLNAEEKQVTLRLLNDFKDLFFKEGDTLSATHEVFHEIVTTIDKPLYSRIYRYPQIHESEINRQIEEMLKQNIIRKSNSPYNSPLWIVDKKMDNSGIKKYRIVIDYRKLNEFTVDDKYPIPNLNSLLDRLGRAQYFTTLDLAKGFHQILVREEDRRKTAFSTPSGHYEFVRMPFGLKNAPSTFQRLMNEVLKDHINKTCVVYMDDILIFSTSLQDHMVTLKKIFKALRKAKLKVQVDKCDFLKRETQFLGHVLTAKGIKPNPDKVSIIQMLRIPNTAKQIKSFLGMTGFYRKFIGNYAKIAHPMTVYLKKGQSINTNDPNYLVAFEKLKDLVTNTPILRYPNFYKKFKITTDASNFAIGAVLSQEGHPIAYASRTLNKHECNYATVEKELLAIVWAVKYFRPYIYGREFDLESDHQPLKWLMTKYSGKDISPRLQRWLISLGEYNFSLDYIKGKTNYIADFLSRIREDEINCWQPEDDNREPQTADSLSGDIDQDDIASLEVQTVHSQEEDLGYNVPILETVVNRFKIQIILVEKKQNPTTVVFGNKRIFVEKDDIDNELTLDILRRELVRGKVGIYSYLNDHEYYKVYKIIESEYSMNPHIKFVKCTKFARDIENEDELKTQIALFHKNESCHCGIVATYEKLKSIIYNPNLRIRIHKIINNCDVCSGGKYDRNPIKSKFYTTETPKAINEIVHIDTYINSKQSFITFIDKFSKHAICFPLPDRNARTILSKIQEFIAIKGKIKKFIFDNEFKSGTVTEYLRSENIDFHTTKPNSHTGNSDAERLNNTITEKIRTLNIEEKIPVIMQMNKAITLYNNNYHSTIGCTPLEVQNHVVDHNKIYERLKTIKLQKVEKANKNRETYEEHRENGFIKNYKNVRHKETAKFIKKNLTNIHDSNIKRPTKFSDNHPNHPDYSNNPDQGDGRNHTPSN